MIWGYPYFWNHPNAVFSAKVLLATFGLATWGFSQFPNAFFDLEVYQIWEQEGARLGWWRISILKNAGWFLVRSGVMFCPFSHVFISQRNYINHVSILRRFVMYEMALSSSTFVIFKAYFVCIYIYI